KLLGLMCRRLRDRALVNHVFFSYKSSISDPLSERGIRHDIKRFTQLSAKECIQGMVRYIASTKQTCLVALDGSRPSTSCNTL
ncbi:hypothetical protein CLU79DRAFT_685131, partial [Phycomyces nitens]